MTSLDNFQKQCMKSQFERTETETSHTVACITQPNRRLQRVEDSSIVGALDYLPRHQVAFLLVVAKQPFDYYHEMAGHSLQLGTEPSINPAVAILSGVRTTGL